MQTIAQELEAKTKEYWRISYIWNSRSNETETVGDAIESCTHLISTTNVTRPIFNRASILLDELVLGEASPAPSVNKVLAFPDIASAMQ